MINYVSEGNSLSVTAPYALLSGEGCKVGTLFGVAAADAAISTAVQIERVGVFKIKKTSALAMSQGDLLYWDDSAKELNKTSTGLPVAVCTIAAANPSATVTCTLLPGYSAPIDATILQYASVTITNAQLKALRATPKTLVAAPGAGKVIEFVSLLLSLDYGTNVFTETADNMAVRYTDGSGVIVSQAIEATGFIDAAADTVTFGLPKIDPIVTAAGSANQALVLHNTGDGEWGGNAGADTIVYAKVAYRVHTL